MTVSTRSPADDVVALVCRAIGAIVVVALGVAAFTPLVNDLAGTLAPRAPITRGDAIVVLGAGANPDGSLEPSSLVRLLRGVLLYRRGLAPLLAISGGRGETRTRLAMAGVLGVPADAIVAEWNARTTRDEAAHLGALLRRRRVARILLVTNSEHLIRARQLFERQGFEVVPVPADVDSPSSDAPQVRLEIARSMLEEAVARLYYRLAGYL